MNAVVSRETLAEQATAKSPKYKSPFRKRKAAATRAAIIGAALGFVAEGTFRPSCRIIAAAADCVASAITDHFGSLDGLYCEIAQQHADQVVEAAGILPGEFDASVTRDFAWVIMTGTRRPK